MLVQEELKPHVLQVHTRMLVKIHVPLAAVAPSTHLLVLLLALSALLEHTAMQVLLAARSVPKAATVSTELNGRVMQAAIVQPSDFSSAPCVMWVCSRMHPGRRLAQCAWKVLTLLVRAPLAAWTVLRATLVVGEGW